MKEQLFLLIFGLHTHFLSSCVHAALLQEHLLPMGKYCRTCHLRISFVLCFYVDSAGWESLLSCHVIVIKPLGVISPLLHEGKFVVSNKLVGDFTLNVFLQRAVR